MIICISGPSSTGKTTLFNELQSHCELIKSIYNGKVIFIEEQIRKIAANKYPDKSFNTIIQNSESAISFQLEIADSIYKNYVKILNDNNTLYIIDRSPLDNLVYNIMNYQCDDPEVMIKNSDKLNSACSKMRSLYSYVDRVYLTQVDRCNNSSVERDGFRPEKYEYRRQLEIELFNSIFDFSDKVIKLPSMMSERVKTVLEDFSTILIRSDK